MVQHSYYPVPVYLWDMYILLEYHIGDFGNIKDNENGTATVDIILDKEPRPTLDKGYTSILGRTLVIHEGK